MAELKRVRLERGSNAAVDAALLLQRRPGARSGRGAYTQRVLAVRQANPTILDQATKRIPVKLVQSFRSVMDILKLKVKS